VVGIFCRETPRTREHLWPDWLRRELEIHVPFTVRLEQEEDGVETRDITFETPPFNQQEGAGGRDAATRCEARRSVETGGKPTP
jgi:hypothetical protein